ncbi:MAG: hypothetical protein AAB922_06690 [Patescibacteria group bacterium]
MVKKNPSMDVKSKKEWSQGLIDSLKLKISDNIVMFNKPFDKGLVSEVYPQRSKGGAKPDGVWYACGSAWLEWTLHNMSLWLGDYVYKLDIDKSNFVMIRNEKSLEDFAELYKYPKRQYSSDDYEYMDWKLVASTGFTGIQISPHFYTARFAGGLSWYSTWDVASGCIWDTSCIKDVSIIEF